jgi:hypothetical protein
MTIFKSFLLLGFTDYVSLGSYVDELKTVVFLKEKMTVAVLSFIYIQSS